jgi:hypothetical protein
VLVRHALAPKAAAAGGPMAAEAAAAAAAAGLVGQADGADTKLPASYELSS